MSRSTTVESLAVRARGLSVTLGPRRHRNLVLDDLNFEIPTGQITGLLGPSGSGKTTLMRAIVGVQGHSGELEVLNFPAGKSELRGQIGYVTQSASVYTDLSVRRNLEYFHSVAGSGRGPDEIMASLSISELADRRVSDLSGGQLSRTSLGCALVGQPQLLVMDEPTVGLDPVTRRSLWAQFHQLAEEGTTLIVSSHVLEEASRCDRLILLRSGRIIWQGSPSELLAETHTTSYEDAFLVAIGDPGAEEQ
ncbi:ABC transporter ATP-binding protein [Corynebacterium sp. A21]|uniref:ABC transporter ATP-binding protein n=1 Tax=Corynebacterium sp. A21 TaxID=3457318 RepID=UPI003FD3D75E